MDSEDFFDSILKDLRQFGIRIERTPMKRKPYPVIRCRKCGNIFSVAGQTCECDLNSVKGIMKKKGKDCNLENLDICIYWVRLAEHPNGNRYFESIYNYGCYDCRIKYPQAIAEMSGFRCSQCRKPLTIIPQIDIGAEIPRKYLEEYIFKGNDNVRKNLG